jgi:predicted permease
MSMLRQNLTYALRILAKDYSFAGAAILTLALGIGATTAMFSVIDNFLLRPLPVARSNELVIFGDGLNAGVARGDLPLPPSLFSYPLYESLSNSNQSFQGLCAFKSTNDVLSVQLPGSDSVNQQTEGELVSGNYFSVLGIGALRGRTFSAAEDREPGGAAVAVISYSYWTREFSRDPSAVGKTINVNGTPFTIIGVMPSSFFGEKLEGDPPDIWFPLAMQQQITRDEILLDKQDVYWLILMGRLKSGIDLRRAESNVNVQFNQLLNNQAGSSPSEETQKSIAEAKITLTPGGRGISELRQQFSEALQILTALVVLLLLIACANIANLLMARLVAREREISVRLAVGATRAQLIQQVLTESVVTSVIGGSLGLILALWGLKGIVSLIFAGARNVPVTTVLNIKMLFFSMTVSVLTAMIFGLVPALRMARAELMPSLKENAVKAGERGHKFRFGPTKLLVVGQIALSTILLVGAVIFVGSLLKLENQKLGFERENVLLVRIDLRLAGYHPAQLPTVYRQLQESMNAVPGVRSATLSMYSFMSGLEMEGAIVVQGETPKSREDRSVQLNLVGPQYFETTGIPIILGRPIASQDTESSPHVAIINETLSKDFFPNQNPIGKQFSLIFAPNQILEIVGVMKDAKYNNLRDKPPRMAVIALSQWGNFAAERAGLYANDLEIRTLGDPRRMANDVRRSIFGVSKNIPVMNVSTLSGQVDQSLHEERLLARLSGFFGILALLVACLGIYGLMAYSVARRTKDIGIRMALGARSSAVAWMVMREALLIAAVGLSIGVPAAWALTRLVTSELYGLAPGDPATMLIAPALLSSVAAVATFLPAWRASRVDPMSALRFE